MNKLNNTNELTVEMLQRIISNPFYAINIDENLCVKHETLISEEDFIKASVKSIEENGAELYVRNLLENLKGNYVMNPNFDSVDGYKWK